MHSRRSHSILFNRRSSGGALHPQSRRRSSLLALNYDGDLVAATAMLRRNGMADMGRHDDNSNIGSLLNNAGERYWVDCPRCGSLVKRPVDRFNNNNNDTVAAGWPAEPSATPSRSPLLATSPSALASLVSCFCSRCGEHFDIPRSSCVRSSTSGQNVQSYGGVGNDEGQERTPFVDGGGEKKRKSVLFGSSKSRVAGR